MSFSSDVKRELANYFESKRHCSIAELAAILLYNGFIFKRNNELLLKIQSENEQVVKKSSVIISNVFKINAEPVFENKNYVVFIENGIQSHKILSATGLIDENSVRLNYVNPLIYSSVCCKRAYIRGCFLCAGSLCNPEKNYHLEFVNSDVHNATYLMNVINSFHIESKIIRRKGSFVVYIKDGEQIVDMLNIMNAHKALMALENVRILKDVRNNVNRIVNCETANLNKVVSASVKHRQTIEYIAETIGFDKLPKQLKQIAELRIEHPDSSLKELGQMLNPPVGKSGVNHRLKKIADIADSLKEDICYVRKKN